MKTKRVSREKRELMKLLEIDLLNYKQFLGIHRDKERLDREINDIVEKLKQID